MTLGSPELWALTRSTTRPLKGVAGPLSGKILKLTLVSRGGFL